jgi:uncharacterized protein (TIGR03437 family)
MKPIHLKFLAVGIGLLTGSLMQAQTTPVTCSASTLSGTYALVLDGRDVASAALTKASVAVGTATFDGSANVTFNLTDAVNSTPGAAQTLSGTYSLPSNCLGSVTITNGDSASFTLIPYNTGKNFTLTGLDATYSYTGSGSLQPAACLTATLSGAYGFSGNGYELSAGNITGTNVISGLLQFDGAGSVTGNWSFSTNGTTTSITITGQYTVSSSCVANATVKDNNGIGYTLAMTVTSTNAANISLIGTSTPTLFTATAHSTFTNPGVSIESAAGVPVGTPPGSLFSIYGNDLAVGQLQNTTDTWGTTLDGTTVTVNGEAVPLYFVEGILINAQMPLDVTPGLATVVVKNASGTSNAAAITVPATAYPTVFINGNNHAAAENFPSYAINSPTAPAPVGSTVIIYFTGGGPVQGGKSLVNGHPTPNQSFPVTEPYSATLAGVSATLQYVGLTPTLIGVYQANMVVPSVASGSRTLVLTIGGNASNSTVLSVQ